MDQQILYVAFTGTQRGMTLGQHLALASLLHRIKNNWEKPVLRLGDCIGSDQQCFELARELGGFTLIGHPPVNPVKRAFCRYDLEMEPEEYLVRNRRMVNLSGSLIAAPGEMTEVLRSGTWSTVRHARRVGVPVSLVLPDGTMGEDR